MLPSLRFLIAAVALSASVLIFGFGAAALLRAAREDFNTIAAWRQPHQTMANVRFDSAPPSLALLRVEPSEPVAAREPSPGIEQQQATLPPLEAAPSDTPVTSSEDNLPKPESEPVQLGAKLAPGDVKISESKSVNEKIVDIKPHGSQAAAKNNREIKQASLGTQTTPAQVAAETAQVKKVQKRRRAVRTAQRRKITIARTRIIRSQQRPADPFTPFGTPGG